MMTRARLRSPAPLGALWPLTCALLATCTPNPPGAGPAVVPAVQFVEGPAPEPIGAPEGRCFATLPDSLLTVRDTVYLHALILDPTARALLVQADLLAQRVAYRLRRLLGGRLDSLPAGEPAVTWRTAIGGNLRVKAQRDGGATWQELLPMPFPDTVGTRLLARAVDSVVAHGEMVAWPPEVKRDFVEIRLALTHSAEPSFAQAIGAGFPAFLLRRPAEERPQLLAHPPVHYPEEMRQAGIEGHLVVRVIIDAQGRPEPGSIQFVWPEGRPRPSGRELAEYLEFAEVSRDVVLGSRYEPGRLGGCPLRTRVEIPLNYTVVRGPN
jgi:hypothetical protein